MKNGKCNIHIGRHNSLSNNLGLVLLFAASASLILGGCKGGTSLKKDSSGIANVITASNTPVKATEDKAPLPRGPKLADVDLSSSSFLNAQPKLQVPTQESSVARTNSYRPELSPAEAVTAPSLSAGSSAGKPSSFEPSALGAMTSLALPTVNRNKVDRVEMTMNVLPAQNTKKNNTKTVVSENNPKQEPMKSDWTHLWAFYIIAFTFLFLIWVIYDVFKAERNDGEAAQKRKPAAKRASRKKPAKKAVKKAVKKKAPKKKS
jgi:hypothetical protein